MMKKFGGSLSEKALIGIVVVLLPILIAFSVTYTQNRAYLKQRVLDTLTVIAEAYEGQVYQFLEMAKRRAQDFASDGFIRSQLQKILGGNPYASKALNKHLIQNKLVLDKTIHTINILSLDGLVVASTNGSELGKDLSDKSFFLKGKDAAVMEESFAGHTGFPEITISAPILHKETGRLIGVIVNVIYLSEVNKLLLGEFNKELGAISWGRGKGAWKTMEVYLVNKDKLMVTKSIFVKDAILKQVVDTLPVGMGLSSRKEMAGFYTDYRGVEVVGASMYVPSMNWVLLVEIDKDEVLAPIRNVFLSVLITAAVVIVMIVFLFIAFLKRVVKPLRTISDATEDIAVGDFEITIPVRGSDEIGVLSRSFNSMAQHIKARTSALVESKERLAEAQRIAHLGNWEWIVVTNELHWSDEIYHIFGLIPQEFGATYEAFLDRVYPDDREFVKKSVDDALYEKKPYDIEHRILLKDATVRIVHEKAMVIRDKVGKAIRMVGTVQDITERRHREEEVNLLQSLILAVGEAKDLHDALVVTLEKVCRATGWVYGEAWIPDTEGKYLERDHTFYSRVDSLEKFSEVSGSFRFSPGVGLPGRTWLLKQPVWVRDVTSDTNFPRNKIAREAGLKAGVAFPVLADDDVVAIIAFYMFEPREKDVRLINLVSSAAVQLGQIIRRKRMEEALRKNEHLLQSIFDNTTTVIYVKDVQERYTLINRQFENLFHIKREAVKGKTDYDLWPPGMADTFRVNDRKVIKAKIPMEFEETARHDDGIHTYISIKFPLYDQDGVVVAVCGISTDVTERKRLEQAQAHLREQLYHAQKLESVGKLAGGIAHDFNNVLMAITGYGKLIQMETDENGLVHDYAEKILASSERAAQLVQGLLAFSRKQASRLRPVNLNETVKRAEHLLLRLIGEDTKLVITLTKSECVVLADSGQIEQVLMNLATNARDAMPDGGTLAIGTESVELDGEFVRMHGLDKVGPYAVVSVSDTGWGMDEETKKRIFEPFFTTKEIGKGTGLGLAMVYGIVQQHHGAIDVLSKPGGGATFKIYLPVVNFKAEEIAAENLPSPVGGTETILLAEDEDGVREIVRTICNRAGYKVIEAIDGDDAIRKFKENKDGIQLFVSDVMMPGKNGKEAYDEIRTIRPDMKAVFMSGYAEDVISNKTVLDEKLHFIPKPILPSEFLRKIRMALDG